MIQEGDAVVGNALIISQSTYSMNTDCAHTVRFDLRKASLSLSTEIASSPISFQRSHKTLVIFSSRIK